MNSMRLLAALLLISFLLLIASCEQKSRFNIEEADRAAIKDIYTDFSSAFAVRDVNRIMAHYVPDETLLAYDAFIPREYKGARAYRKDYVDFFAIFPGKISSTVDELNIVLSGDYAYANCIDTWQIADSANQKMTMAMRVTDIFHKTDKKWLIVHEHLSFPVDPATGKADYLARP
jgi:ketosteroid isomerase-like protein